MTQVFEHMDVALEMNVTMMIVLTKSNVVKFPLYCHQPPLINLLVCGELLQLAGKPHHNHPQGKELEQERIL